MGNREVLMLFALRYWKWIAAGLAVLALVGTVWAHLAADQRTRNALAALQGKAADIVLATQAASGNDAVTLDIVPGQILALGESNRALKQSVEVQNRAISDMAREAVRLRAKASEMQIIADKAKAQRAAALKRLSDLSITPGTRADCMILLREANEALDLAHGALREREQ
jgi:hypothetical protein